MNDFPEDQLEIPNRLRRLRKTASIRHQLRDVVVVASDLVQPYFLTDAVKDFEPIKGFTDVFRFSVESFLKQVDKDREKGLKHFLLFGNAQPSKKNKLGSYAFNEKSVLAKAIFAVKKHFGNDVIVSSDVCLCPFTDHGHCGIVKDEKVENDASVVQLAKMALLHAQMGADFIAPSDMMDGRVGFIRKELDAAGFTDTGILAYSVKYSSNYYGPFREALASSPKSMSRESYQMDYHRSKEFSLEVEQDIFEGADIIMVKPALAYLDIIFQVSQMTSLPVAAYSVSGEYEFVKQMVACEMAKESALAMENLTAIKRAGAKLLISYFSSKAVREGWLS